MSELTAKQKRFCEEYLVDLNATQAAIRAGYSESTAYSIGWENLKKPDVENYLADLMAKRSAKTDITAEHVLKTIKDTMDKSVADDDRQNAYKGAELLGKHLKLFTDKVDLGGQDDNPLAVTVKYVD